MFELIIERVDFNRRVDFYVIGIDGQGNRSLGKCTDSGLVFKNVKEGIKCTQPTFSMVSMLAEPFINAFKIGINNYKGESDNKVDKQVVDVMREAFDIQGLHLDDMRTLAGVKSHICIEQPNMAEALKRKLNVTEERE